MAFQPQVDQELTIDTVTYRIAEHPVARGMPYGQEGRAAVVYKLVHGDRTGLQVSRALKVFKPRFREPGLVALSLRLAAFADMPGLSVCKRTVLTPQSDQQAALVREYPDLIYAVLMPWIDGPTWMEVLLDEQALSPEQSLQIARSLCSILADMENRGLAHCDLSGPNVLIPLLAAPDLAAWATATRTGVALVDVEQMYGPGLKRPLAIPAGSSGYAHRSVADGMWSASSDRFAGAVLLAEMLGWCGERVRKASWGENYFDPAEMQTENQRYKTLLTALKEQWGDTVADLFSSAWSSETLADCPSFSEWYSALYQLPSPEGDLDSIVPLAAGYKVPIPAPTPALSRVQNAQQVFLPPPAPDQPLQTVPSATLPLLQTPSPPLQPAQRTQRPPFRPGWAVIVPALLVLFALFAGSFMVLRSQVTGPAVPTPTVPVPATATVDGTARARANATATAIALATRFPGAISPATVGSLRLLGTLRGHTGPVLSVAVSPDGLMLASASADSTVRLWSRSNGDTLAIFTGHTGAVNSVSFAPDSKTLVSGSVDKTARFWDTSARTSAIAVGDTPSPDNATATPPLLPNRVLNFAASVWMAIFSLTHNIVAVASGDGAQIYDPGSDTPTSTLPNLGLVKRLRFGPNDETLASGSDDGTVSIWRIDTGALLRSMHDHMAAINDIQFSADGELMAVASEDQTITVYDAATGALAFTLKGHTGGVRAIAFSPDGQTLASGGADNTLRLWNLHDGSLMRTLNTGATLNSLAFTPDGTELVAGADDDTLMLWGTDSAFLQASATPEPTNTAAATETPSPTATLPLQPTHPVLSGVSTPTTVATKTRVARTSTGTPLRTPTVRPLTPTLQPTHPLPTATRTSSPIPVRTFTPTLTPTQPPVPTATPTLLRLTATHIIAPSLTPTRRPTNTFTPIPTSTSTPVPTQTFTEVPAPTNTRRPTTTPTETPEPTHTRVPTYTRTPTEVPTDTPTPTPVDTDTPTPPPAPCAIYQLSASSNGCSLTVTWSYSGNCAARGVLTGVVRGAAGPYLNDDTIGPDSSPYYDSGPGQCTRCTISYRLTLYDVSGQPVSSSTAVSGFTCIP
jgi:WD40 repeat protein